MHSEEPEGADVVPGVLGLRRLGFEPVEEYTGALWVAHVWPEEHRASVTETRDFWLRSMPETGGRVWLLRSPWPSLSLQDAINAMWRWMEKLGADHDVDTTQECAADFLAWPESKARDWAVVTPTP